MIYVTINLIILIEKIYLRVNIFFKKKKSKKVAAKENGNIGAYKKEKGEMMQKLFPKAEEWKAKQIAANGSK